MTTQQAREIAQSPEMKHVTHNGQHVYIQQVDDQNKTARIFPLDEPENEFTVPINGLQEH
ncbi:H-type small acid-soluble spore protein [Virgibacillus sp. W0181]|uniref:H-type small acid-soluble spore protein n=1 Tax=Virgibacillus sp. W0181 TaxID=3391581 RepID=UPI003F486C93